MTMDERRLTSVSAQQRAEEYRERARACLADMQAERLPGRREKLRLSAQRWLTLAEAEDRIAASLVREDR